MFKSMISIDGNQTIFKKGDSLVRALKGISLDIKQGEIFGVLGRAGSGKSALIRRINLVEPPAPGSPFIDQYNVVTLTTEGLHHPTRHIGIILHQSNLLSSRTIYENVAFPLEISGHSKEDIQNIVDYVLDITELSEGAHLYPSQLTVGEKQRVAIARALVLQPKVLVCEDITLGLEVKAKNAILRLLKDINKKLNLSLLILTHELDVMKAICQKAAVIHQGKIVESGNVLDLLSNPVKEITKDLIKMAARQDLPSNLRDRLRSNWHENSNPILRISFQGEATNELFFNHFVQRYNLSVNIIQAHLETIQNGKMGIMIVELIGEQSVINDAMLSLEHTNLHIEVLGYAPRIT